MNLAELIDDGYARLGHSHLCLRLKLPIRPEGLTRRHYISLLGQAHEPAGAARDEPLDWHTPHCHMQLIRQKVMSLDVFGPST